VTVRLSRRSIEDDNRFLSSEACKALAERVIGMARGGGDTTVIIRSQWTGNLRWARNRATTAGDTRDHEVLVYRVVNGASAGVRFNQLDDASLAAGVRRAERLSTVLPEALERITDPPPLGPYSTPPLWSDATWHLDAAARSAAAAPLVEMARAKGLLSAGYIEVSASGEAHIASNGSVLYYPSTSAQYSVTVRNTAGTGSGWAGVDNVDWSQIDTATLSARAADKCLRSANPVAIEPGRWTVILEPQATSDLFAPVMNFMARLMAENGAGPFAGSQGRAKFGERVLDPRLTLSANPMDPDAPFIPFELGTGDAYAPTAWIENGILRALEYDRGYAVAELGLPRALPNSGAFRLAGGSTSMDDMIHDTRRGLLITRFDNIDIVNYDSLVMTGYTRDGVWLIENGAITKAAKNFRFTESPLFALNNVEQVGPTVRVFRPGAPTMAPALKVRDFSLTSLADAV
jgi:predicted Zn-dependent protease